MKINIAATHRFHLLDLARELADLGHDVKFYSYVPYSRSKKFGLKRQNTCSIFIYIFPILILERLFSKSNLILKLKFSIIDFILTHFTRKCDFFIGLGTVYKNAFIKAKKNGAITILEWGSKHILEQEKNITLNSKAKKLSTYFINKDLYNYEIVDYIAIPSLHVKNSFLEYEFSPKKLLINPYGVDLNMFYPTILNNKCYDIIFVGNWSYTKGCDYIIEIINNSNFTFLHVGSIKDIEFPIHPRMTHIDSVEQNKLVDYYSLAKVFILPSRAEGLAMVQAQAVACGLPIVCSKNTGGSDLRNLISAKDWIIEFEDYSINSILNSINQAIILAQTQKDLRNYVLDDINNLSWKEYGKRYSNNLFRIKNAF